MIQKAIYTYGDITKGRSFGFRTESIFLDFFNDSLAASVEQFNEVEVYCDPTEVGYLKKHITTKGVTITGVDYSVYSYDRRFWNYKKAISAYLNATAGIPFLHIDLDAYLLRQLTAEQLSAPILCEKRRDLGLFKSQLSNRLPRHIVDNYHPYIICSGLFGGNDLDLFIEYFNAITEVVKVDFQNYEDVNFLVLVQAEELTMTAVAQKRKQSITTLLKDDFIHLSAGMKQMI